MFDSGAQQSIHSHRSQGMAVRRQSLDSLPWPTNLLGEYATINELLSGAVPAPSTIRDTGRLSAAGGGQ